MGNMADNIDVTPGTGKTIAADDLAGVLYQRVKISQGADGSATDVSSAAPLNVTLANTGANTNKILVTPDLPTGASTSAKQDTIIGHVDGLEALATTIDADTSNISTKIDTVAGAVSGTEMQVDIVSAPTLTVNAHAVTNAGTFAVQVDGAALTSLQLIDDTVATDGSATPTKGVLIAGQDGTNAQTIKTDSSGELQVDVLSMPTTTVQATDLDIRDMDAASDDITIHGDVGVVDQFDLSNSNPLVVAIVDSSGDQITSFGGGTQYTEDAAAAANPVGTGLILVRDDARAGSLTTTDGDNVAARGNNKGEQYVKTTDSDALLTTIDADTSNISTKIDTVAGAVSGSEMQVDIVSAPTLTVNAHAVTNAGTFAVQVDGAALTSLQLADDVVATLGTTTYTEATTKGNIIGAVRRDADTTLVDTTNEIGPLQMDANGRLKVEVFSGETLPVSGTVAATQSGTWNVTNVSGTVSLPTGASTSALQTTGNTTLSSIDTTAGLTYSEISLIRAAVPVDDAAFTPGSSRIMMSGFEYDDTTPDSVNEGDAGAARMSANRNIYVNIRDNAGNERGLNIDTNGALASTISSGTLTTVTTVTTVSTITGGGVAHDAADSGNPIKIGGKYYATLPALADGDRGDLVMSREGEVQVRAGGQILKSDVNFTRPSDTTTYASGDVVSDSTSAPNVLTFTGVARANGLGGVIETVMLIDESCSTLAGVFELWLFDTAPTATNDNTAWNISDANMRNVIGVVPLTAAFSGDAGSTGNRVYISPNTGISFKCTSGVTSIYGVLVVRNAFVPTSAERFDIRLTTIAE